MGDIGAVAALLTKAFGFAVDKTGYQQMSRERKLETLMEGINAAADTGDGPTCDALFSEYRRLRQTTGT